MMLVLVERARARVVARTLRARAAGASGHDQDCDHTLHVGLSCAEWMHRLGEASTIVILVCHSV